MNNTKCAFPCLNTAHTRFPPYHSNCFTNQDAQRVKCFLGHSGSAVQMSYFLCSYHELPDVIINILYVGIQIKCLSEFGWQEFCINPPNIKFDKNLSSENELLHVGWWTNSQTDLMKPCHFLQFTTFNKHITLCIWNNWIWRTRSLPTNGVNVGNWWHSMFTFSHYTGLFRFKIPECSQYLAELQTLGYPAYLHRRD